MCNEDKCTVSVYRCTLTDPPTFHHIKDHYTDKILIFLFSLFPKIPYLLSKTVLYSPHPSLLFLHPYRLYIVDTRVSKFLYESTLGSLRVDLSRGTTTMEKSGVVRHVPYIRCTET